MCTILALARVHPRYPLLVLANRDELYAREASGPTVLATSPRIVGGKDLSHGGTWFAVSEHGIFMALTNQRTHGPPDFAQRSRGEVIPLALLGLSIADVESRLSALDGRAYNPFNLMF